MKIWMDGQLLDEDKARVSVMSHTLHYGTGVFEGIRSYASEDSTVVFRLMDHLDRLERSAQAMNLKVRYSKTQLRDAVIDVLCQNNLTDAYIRPLIFVGAGSLSLNFHAAQSPVGVLVAAQKWDRYFESDELTGITVATSIGRRITSQPELHQAKVSGFYANSYAATMAAQAAGAVDAILLDERGFIAEAAVANVFLVRGGKLHTPTCRAALAGYTRDSIIHLAAGLGLEVHEGDLTVEDMLAADEVFLTGTACEVVPVTKVDKKIIKNGAAGPITRQLHTAYQHAARNRHSFKSNVSIDKKSIAA
ncbi:MAG: branched-chain amino acid transaminase [Magnetovibrio sp.]|nr:branched-chain amino acid transaminase [Magnetovibrio sp.]